VRLKTREEAWKEYVGTHADAGLAEVGIDNPLPDTIILTLKSAAAAAAVEKRVRALAGVKEVSLPRTALEQLRRIAALVRTLGIIAGVLLGLASASVIGNAIRITIFARRREIRIMQLVGATNSFIHGPFLCEGIFDGALGAALACGLVTLGYAYLSRLALANCGPLASFVVPPPMAQLYGLLLVAGVLIACMGTTFSLRRHLSL
jgi:cell division transport system permease protein